MKVTSPIRILLVDDHTLFRESLRTLLEGAPNYQVVAEVATVADAMEFCHAEAAAFDLALVDYDLGPTAGAKNGVSVLRCLRERDEFIPALMIAARIDPKDLFTVINELRTGVFLKADPPEELGLALQTTMRREVWISSSVAQDLAAGVAQPPAKYATSALDSREREILGLIMEGLSNNEIGVRLNLSESVVKAILQSLFEKTGVHTRSQLVRFAFEGGDIF